MHRHVHVQFLHTGIHIDEHGTYCELVEWKKTLAIAARYFSVGALLLVLLEHCSSSGDLTARVRTLHSLVLALGNMLLH